MGWLSKAAGFVSSAATGGAYSTDGKSGYLQGGYGVPSSANQLFNTSGFTDFIPGVGDAAAQDKANQQNIALDRMNREWQERMSNTAYQRAMADMKNAGLNPMLAYQQGGASVPSTSAPSVQASSKTGLASSALSAFTGISAARTSQQNAQTQQMATESSVALNTASALEKNAQAENIAADTALKIRELRGKGFKDTLDKKGGELLQGFFDSLLSSAKQKQTEPVIKVLGPSERKAFDGPMIKHK
ncbi:MAG: putative minor capsid protein [Microviridae sp. ctITQ3]|nr:MAG: putative minor capsid protein [Microviridae sp. ctITQ3]